MNGLLNIQVRVQSAQAKAMLKSLEKEIAAVDRALSSQGTATGRLAAFQQNAARQTRALSAAQKELVAAQRAVVASTKAQEAASAQAAAASAAHTKAIQAAAAAQARRSALDANAPAAIAANARALAAHERALNAETAATNRVKDAKLRLKRINEQVRAAERGDGASQAMLDKQIIAERRLQNAKLSRANAEMTVIRTSALSAETAAKAAVAQQKLATADANLAAAQQRVAATAAAVQAANARVSATATQRAAAVRAAAAAEAQLSAAEARQSTAAAAAAAANAKLAASHQAARAAAAAHTTGILAATGAITKFANRAQWAGRQMQSNFTLPIFLAGGFAVKFALDNEKAMTKLKKVYGDDPTADYKQELDLLAESMELLSVKFGTQQDEVIAIGAAWAAAGARGKALAVGVEQTLRTMVVGEMEAEEATKALISIQAQWQLNTEELTQTMNMLNAVENQTAVSLSDLVDAYARAAGTAKNMGVTQRELAAAVAALVPATGSAASAGNGLKTIYSRLLTPTREAVDILKEMGIQTDANNWKNLTAHQRLEALAEQYSKMDKSQRAVAAATFAGRYQLNRAEQAIDSLLNKQSAYWRALEVTADKNKVLEIAQKELNEVLESNPQKLKQLGVILQNTAADVGVKLIPAVMAAAAIIVSLAKAFNDLSPIVQKSIIAFLVMVALTGPIIRWGMGVIVLGGYMMKMFAALGVAAMWTGRMLLMGLLSPFRLVGAAAIAAGVMILKGFRVLLILPRLFATARGAIILFFSTLRALALMGTLWRGMLIMAAAGMRGLLVIVRTGMMRLIPLLLGPPGLIAAAIIAVVVLFKDEIANMFNSLVETIRGNSAALSSAVAPLVGFFHKAADMVVGAFNKLPEGIQAAMLAVVRVVASAVRAVYDLFSYLNPFARHSPSLVENVTEGMAVVRNEFASISSISGPINKAYADIQKFKDSTRGLMKGFESVQQLEQFQELMKVSPGSGGAFKTLVRDLQVLSPIMDRLEEQVQAQERVVAQWERTVELSNRALDRQKEKLQDLEDVAAKYNDRLQESQDRLAEYASTPIKGMRAMEDAIFANTMAQKRLQLQMMDMEDAVGPMQDLQGRMEALNGAIEMLRGEQADLRSAGAGSDILDTYDAQIKSLEQQQGTINETASEYNDLQKQLAALERQGQRLDLTKSLKFDELTRQIEQAAHGMEELPFNKIMEGIAKSNAEIDKYQGLLDKANKKVAEQQKVVDAAQAAHDKLVDRYEAEKRQLEDINAKYKEYKDAVDAVKSSLDAVNQAATGVEKAKKGKGAGGSDYVSPALQNFRDAAGGNFPTDIGTAGKSGGPDIPGLEKFNEDLRKEMQGLTNSLDIFGPIKKQWNRFTGWWSSTVVPGFKGLFRQMVPGTDNMSMLGSRVRYEDTPFFTSIKQMGTKVQEIFKSDQMKSVGDGIVKVFNGIAAVVRLFLPDIKDLANVIKDSIIKAWQTWRPEVEKIGVALGRFWNAMKPLVALLGGALLLALKIIASVFTEVLGRALDVVIDLVGDILEVFAGLLNFISFIFTGDLAAAWDAIKQIFTGAIEAVVHLFEGLVSLVYGVIKGFVEGIIGFFVWLWDELVGHSIIPDMINAIVNWFKRMPGMILGALGDLVLLLLQKGKDLVQGLWNGIKWVWETVKNFYLGLGSKVLELIGNVGSTLYNKGKDLLQGLWNGIKSIWTSVSDWIGDKVQWIVDKFGGIKNSLAGKFSGMFDGIKDAFRGAINFVIGGWNRLQFRIPGFKIGPVGYDGFTLSVPQIPMLAKGGVADRNKLHVVGEFGPELFIPGKTGRVSSNNDIQRLMTLAVQEGLSSLANTDTATAFRMPSPAALATATAAAGRRVAVASATPATVQNATVTNNTEYHFHGDLSFPNIKSGEDAEMFLTNLSDLAG